MKIQLVSDLHLEFGAIDIPNAGADTLILSGDITVACVFEKGESITRTRTEQLFDQVCKDFKNVVYVLGNHEHYHGDYSRSAVILRDVLGHHKNLSILDTDTVDIGGVLFVGGTLWTNFSNDNPVVKFDASRMMNDYRTVSNGTNSFHPDDAMMYHENMMKFIDETYVTEMQKEAPRPIVVVGHHAPSKQSVDGRYATDRLAGAYSSDLDGFIEAHPGICLWTHGHIHVSADYLINKTRVVCNPRGYHKYEVNAGFQLDKIIEI